MGKVLKVWDGDGSSWVEIACPCSGSGNKLKVYDGDSESWTNVCTLKRYNSSSDSWEDILNDDFCSGGGGGTTTKIQVKIAEFDDTNDCACSLTSTTQIWEDDVNQGGAGIEPSVDDWVNDAYSCAQVIAVNATGTADSYTNNTNADCDDCNDELLLCEGGGEGYCLLPHMLVKLIDGSFTKVINLNLGDLIEGPSGFTEVNSLIKNHPRDGYYIIENELYISDGHPILVNGEMIKAKDYPGNKRYVKLSTDTVYVGTVLPVFNVYCENNTYTVDGHYGPTNN
jgi:hypothetical protein